jgi:MFS family permease
MRGNALVMSITEPIGQGILFLTSTFWPLYVLELKGTLYIIGLLSLVSGLIRVLVQIPVGYLTDVIGRKKLVVWGGFIASFAPFIYLLAFRWEHLIPGVILEAFTNIVLPARQAMFADAVDSGKRATAFAAIHTLFALFSTVMPILGGFLMERVGLLPGMRTALLASGIVMLTMSLVRSLFLQETMSFREAQSGKFRVKSALADMFDPVLTLGVLRVAVLGSFLYSLAVGFLRSYSVVYAVDVIGLSKAQWGLVAGGMGVVGIMTRIPTGLMIDRLSRKLCILVSYTTRPILIIAFTLAVNFPQVLLIQMVDNVLSYVQQPALEALAVDIASQRRRGRAYGALNMIPGVALTVAPILGAVIWEAHGADRAFYSSALFSAMAALVLLFFLQEPEEREN